MKKQLGMIVLILSLGCAACGNNSNNADNNSNNSSVDETPDVAVDTSSDDASDDQTQEDAQEDVEPDVAIDAQVVPTNATDLFAYLQASAYTDLPAEPEAHASTGPHGRVRTYVNDVLRGSIDARQDTHPVGSAAIKELYRGDDLTGWAVSVKVADEAGSNENWYWYEVFSTTTNNPVADSTNAPGCSGCHGGGTDFVLTSGPFTGP